MVVGGDVIIASAFMGLTNKTDTPDERTWTLARTSGRIVMTGLLSPIDSFIRNCMITDAPLQWAFSGQGALIDPWVHFRLTIVELAVFFSVVERYIAAFVFGPVYRTVVSVTSGEIPGLTKSDSALPS